jgi:hypothetical protein
MLLQNRTGRQVVNGLMAHPAENILDLTITGLDEPLGVTTTHPIWSETRQDFVQANDLRQGEQLRSAKGEVARIVRITPHRGLPQPVYNLEVNAEHVYQVAACGLLVHNAGCVNWATSHPDAMKPEHLFSDDHIRSGIDTLGESRPAIRQRVGEVIADVDEAGSLVSGSNQIETVMNGQPATIRAFLSTDGKLMSGNVFPGKTERKLGKIIPW